MNIQDKTRSIWAQLYPQNEKLLDDFLKELSSLKIEKKPTNTDWYKDAVVYSLYVDLFAKNFDGLTEKLDYLQNLGVNCLWLLPILDSPMRDAGFDIRNYDLIRHELLGLSEDFTKSEQEKVFGKFLKEAHSRGLRVIFDVALNHVSETHAWFQQAIQSEDNPYHDYFIWSDNTSKYADARIIFKGMEKSNWEPKGNSNFFHRFFNFQPDLNYRNPKVLLSILRVFIYWQQMGVDGFRTDAIPYIWKEEGTDCENLPQTHQIVKFFRCILDSIKPGTLLLAEACQQPKKVIEYMGDGDECHAAYHFPLMPMIYKAIAKHESNPIENVLSTKVTPKIPDNSQWFTFIRCHDELSLELVYVSEEDRKYIHEQYCREPEWDFRMGEGISARLANLMQFDERRIGLVYSIITSLPGTPVIYYGDEFGKGNDNEYYKETTKLTGKDDTRFLVRGKIDWQNLENQLKDKSTFESKIINRIINILTVRKQHPAFGRGKIDFLKLNDSFGNQNTHILAYNRIFKDDKLLIIQNLSDTIEQVVVNQTLANQVDLLSNKTLNETVLEIEPYGYHWFLLK